VKYIALAIVALVLIRLAYIVGAKSTDSSPAILREIRK